MIVKNSANKKVSFSIEQVRYSVLPRGETPFPDVMYPLVALAIAPFESLSVQFEDPEVMVQTLSGQYPVKKLTQITSHVKYERNPCVFKDSSGLYWLWYVRNNTLDSRNDGDVDATYYSVYYKTSADGISWSDPVAFSEELPATFSPREMSFMQDGDGVYHLFIFNGVSGSPNDDRLLHHFTSLNGATWLDVGPVSITNWASDPAQVGHGQVIFANDTFYMAFQARSNASVYFTKSEDGITWSAYETLHAADYQIPRIAYVPGEPDKIMIVSTKGTDISLSISDDDGANWASADKITYASSWDPSLVVMPSGDLMIIWAPGVGGDGQQIMISISDDAGATWGDPEAMTVGLYDSNEWWDYWPFPFVDGDDLLIFFSSEQDSQITQMDGGNIWMYKYNDFITSTNDIRNSSNSPGKSLDNVLNNLEARIVALEP